MKQRLRILLEESLSRTAHKRAEEEGRTLDDLIQDALVDYLSKRTADAMTWEEAYKTFCERPIRINRKQTGSVLKEDAWNQ